MATPKKTMRGSLPEHVLELLLSPLYSLKATVSSKTWDLRSQGLRLDVGLSTHSTIFLGENDNLSLYICSGTRDPKIYDPRSNTTRFSLRGYIQPGYPQRGKLNLFRRHTTYQYLLRYSCPPRKDGCGMSDPELGDEGYGIQDRMI